MSRKAWLFIVLLIAAVVTVVVLLGNSSATTPEPWKSVLERWQDPGYWLFLCLVFLFGMAGGVIYELLSLGGRIEWPHPAEKEELLEDLRGTLATHLYDLGILARLFIGGGAAVVVLWVLELEGKGATAVLASSLLAGATGGAVFRTLKDRLLAALKSKDLARVQGLAGDFSSTVKEMEKAIKDLKASLAQARTSLKKAAPAGSPPPPPLELPELERIDTLLGEARALSAAAARG